MPKSCLVPGFIFNVGRCGSVFLQSALGAAENAKVVHEVKDGSIRDYWWNRVKEGVLAGDDLGHTYLDMRGEDMKECSIKGLKYIDTSPWNVYGFVPYILTFFLYGKFVHLVRNGKTNVRSWANRHPEIPFGNWCNYWAEGNLYIKEHLQAAKVMGAEYRMLKMEDITTPLIQDLYDYFGLDNLNEELIMSLIRSKPNKTEEYKLPAYEEWPKEWKGHFDMVCGPVNKELGYE